LAQKETEDLSQEAGKILAENEKPSQEIAEELTDDAKQTNADIFYWGDGCPHCHTVQEWIKENNVEEKIEIISKEVYNNRANSAELTVRAESCGMDTQRIGVPFLYTIDGQCLVGSPNIIDYLAAKID
jgi:glutaredoxin